MAALMDAILNAPGDENLETMKEAQDKIDENSVNKEDDISIANERYEDYKKNPQDSLDWNDVKEKLFLKYGLDNKD